MCRLISSDFIKIVFLLLLSLSCKNSSNTELKQNLNIDFTKIDSLFNSAIKNQEIPGAVVLISRNEEHVYKKAFGYSKLINKEELQINSIFRMASMTKPLTAVAILQLVEKGLISIDDPIKKYLAEFKNPEILIDVLPDSTYTSRPAENDITIKQLLTHSSGLGYGFQDENYNALVVKNNISEGFCEDNRTSFENINKIANLPLLAEPGTKYIYSLSFDVLGVLIEKVTELRYDKYISKNILKPLGMHNSYFTIPKNLSKNVPQVYQPTPDSSSLIETTYKDVNYPFIESRQFFSGGADLCSTAEDFNKFLSMIKNRGELNGIRILDRDYVEMMLSEQVKFNDWDSNQGFGLWFVNKKGAENGLRPLDSFDSGGFFDTYSWVDTRNEFSAIVLLQMYPNNVHDIHWKFQQIIYKNLNKNIEK